MVSNNYFGSKIKSNNKFMKSKSHIKIEICLKEVNERVNECGSFDRYV